MRGLIKHIASCSSIGLVTALLAVSSLTAQIKAKLDTTQMRIGEELQLLIEVKADSTDFVMFPEGKNFGDFEVIRSYPVDTLSDKSQRHLWELRKKYGLTQFDSGVYRLTKQRVMINDSAFDTPEFNVAVLTIPVDTTQQQIFAIKPSAQVPLKNGYFGFLALLIALIAAGILGYYFWNRHKSQRGEKKPPPLPPYEEAMQRWKILNQKRAAEGFDAKPAYSELTDIIKTYIDREIDHRALESTTDELIDRLVLHKMGDHFYLKQETINGISELLHRADLIKFAKSQVTAQQWDLDQNHGLTLIQELKSSIPLPEAIDPQLALDAEALAKRKQKAKRVGQALTALAVLLVVVSTYVAYVGPLEAKDQIFGNAMRDLKEGPWYTSEYGVPAVILETPEILMRKTFTHPDQDSLSAKSTAIFEAFALEDDFYIAVTSTEAQPGQKWNASLALNRSLVLLEEQGARTLIVKDEAFETPEGIKGIRAYGSFYVANAYGKTGTEPHQYELLVFDQMGGIQTVMVAYVDDKRFAQELKDRIINSVSLEIPESNQNPKQP